MKPTRECEPDERMLRALLVIDAIAATVFERCDYCEPPKTLEHKLLGDIYSIAHWAHGHCCDNDRFNIIDERAAELKAAGRFDLEQVQRDHQAKIAADNSDLGVDAGTGVGRLADVNVSDDSQ